MTGGRPVLILRGDELAEAVPLVDVVDAVERGYRLAGTGGLEQHPRIAVHPGAGRTFLHVMPAVAHGAGVAGAHVYTGGNRGRDAVQKVTLVFGTDDGGLRAIIESNWLSWARTGATGAVAARYLAPVEARALGLIGAGRQARAALELMAASRSLEAVYVFSREPAHRQDFAAAMRARTGLPVEALGSAKEVIAQSDIVSTTTTARDPVFPAAALHAGLHLNAIGAHYPDRREIDGPTVAGSRLFVDDPARSRLEDGELALAIAEGAIAADPPIVGLADVVSGRDPGRQSADEVTLFLSGGLASEYLAVAAAVVECAERLGLGRRIEL